MAAVTEQEIKDLRESIEKAKGLRVRYHERLKAREEEQERLITQMKEASTAPETIAADIEQLDATTRMDVDAALSLLPMALIKAEG